MKVSGTPSILKDLIKEGNDVVNTMSIAKETELNILRKINDTTLNPFSVKPIFCGIV
jgi:hypothetical protein